MTKIERNTRAAYEKARETRGVNDSITAAATAVGITEARARELLGFKPRAAK